MGEVGEEEKDREGGTPVSLLLFDVNTLNLEHFSYFVRNTIVENSANFRHS